MFLVIVLFFLSQFLYSQDDCCGCYAPPASSLIAGFSLAVIDSQLITDENDRNPTTACNWDGGYVEEGNWGYALFLDESGDLTSSLTSFYLSHTPSDTVIYGFQVQNHDAIIGTEDYTITYGYIDINDGVHSFTTATITGDNILTVIDTSVSGLKELFIELNATESVTKVGFTAFTAVWKNYFTTVYRKPLATSYSVMDSLSWTPFESSPIMLTRSTSSYYLNTYEYNFVNGYVYLNVETDPSDGEITIFPALTDTLWFALKDFTLKGNYYQLETARPSVVKYLNEELIEYPDTGDLYANTWRWGNDTLSVYLLSEPDSLEVCYLFSLLAFGEGSVSKSPDQPSYALGMNVIVTATPDSGYSFNTWTQDLVSQQSTDTILINGDTEIFARFSRNTPLADVSIWDLTNMSDLWSHARYVRNSFLDGYAYEGKDYPDTTLIVNNNFGTNGEQLRIADSLGCRVVIASLTGWRQDTVYANQYYPMYLYMPVGANTYMDLFDSDSGRVYPSIVLTAAGDDSAMTAYEPEFYGRDPLNYPYDYSNLVFVDSLSIYDVIVSKAKIQISSTSDTVTGIGSKFVSGFEHSTNCCWRYPQVGDRVYANEELRTIIEVIDNTHLRVNHPFSITATLDSAWRVRALSSFSNPYIAGQMLYIADSLNIDLSTVRQVVRDINTWQTRSKGFGAIPSLQEFLKYYQPAINYYNNDVYLRRR